MNIFISLADVNALQKKYVLLLLLNFMCTEKWTGLTKRRADERQYREDNQTCSVAVF